MLVVRRRHWLTFVGAGRWFVLCIVVGIVVAALNRAPDDGLNERRQLVPQLGLLGVLPGRGRLVLPRMAA